MKLDMKPFGNNFRIDLPSSEDATFELFKAIDSQTDIDFAIEDDGYVVVHTDSANEAEVIKGIVEEYLSDSATSSKYGDVKGLEPGDKDIDRIEGIREKANGDEAKMLKLAQNMANTFKNANSYEKCMRRAKAAEILELGGIAKIFYKKAEEIKPQDVAASYDWEDMGDTQFNKQITVEVGDKEVTIDVIKDEIHELGVDCEAFNITVPIDGVSFDRAMIAANKFIDALSPEVLESKEKTKELLLGMLGQSSKAGKVKDLLIELTDKFLDETKGMNPPEAERLAQKYEKEHKLDGLASELIDAFTDSMESVAYVGDVSFNLKTPRYGDEQTAFLKKLKQTFKDIDAKFLNSTLLKVYHCSDDLMKQIVKKFEDDIDLEVATAADFLENKYSNEEEEFTIEEFEKDAGPIPELKKYKTSFYSIVHYNKETDQFEIMIYPKETDYNKNNPKVVVLDSNLSTVATSDVEDAKSRNLQWGFRGALNGAPFNLSDEDASNAFILTVHYISNRTGYMENVIRDFLDSQAGRFLGDMVSDKPMESGNLDSVSKAIKDTIGEGALNKLRFENFVSNHDPSDFVTGSNDEEIADAIQEVYDEYFDSAEFTLVKSQDEFNKKGDVLTIMHEDQGFPEDGFAGYIRCSSSNPKIGGDDIWSMEWFHNKLSDKTLTSGDEQHDQEIVKALDNVADMYNYDEDEYDDEE